MGPKLYEVELPPPIFARGFWLYAWVMEAPGFAHLCYVGMTGDVTGVAQSPFARAAMHFGANKNANAIRRHLEERGLRPENCSRLKLFVFGSIFPYWHSKPRHRDFDASRERVAAAEKALWNAAKRAGHDMLNGEPLSAKECDPKLWEKVQEAFAAGLGLTS